MNLAIFGFRSGSIVIGGLDVQTTTQPVCYVDPTQVKVLSEDTGPGDVDPTQMAVIS